jgi:hypothetical protein
MSDPNQPHPYGGQQPPYGGEQQPPYGGQQPSYGGEQQPPYGGQSDSPYGQPQYGQPEYGQPQSQPPQYGQPQEPPYGGTTYGGTTYGGNTYGGGTTYGAPPQPYGTPQQPYGTPQPPYGQQQPGYGRPPGPPPPGTFPPPGLGQPPKKGGTGRILGIVGGSLVAVLVLCAGAGYLFGGRDILRERNATVSTPDNVAGLEKINSPQSQAAVDNLSSELKKEVALDKAVAAFYQDPKDPRKVVMLLGGTKLILRPEKELEGAFNGFDDEGGNLQDVTNVDAGELGGTARCGVAEIEGTPVSLCGWADHGSLVLGIFLQRPATESATLLRQIRSEVLTRS